MSYLEVLDDLKILELIEDNARTPKQVLVRTALKNSTTPQDIKLIKPPYTPGAFIHIGKTGGSTLSEVLLNGCHLYKECIRNENIVNSQNQNYVSRFTTYYHIPDFPRHLNEFSVDYKFVVITLRDPLSRARSAFLYTHPINKVHEALLSMKPERYDNHLKKFKGNEKEVQEFIQNNPRYVRPNNNEMYSCFSSLEEYAQLLDNFTNFTWRPGRKGGWNWHVEKGDCASVAKSSLYHVFPNDGMIHQFFDLRHVVHQIKNLNEKAILSARTEFLWQDWETIHRWLGETGTIIQNPNVKRNSTGAPIKNVLSESGREKLCIALKDEYRLYLRILVLSENLSDEERKESLEISRKNCPWLNLTLPHENQNEMFDIDGTLDSWFL